MPLLARSHLQEVLSITSLHALLGESDPAMEARLHYSRPLLQVQAPAASPSIAHAAPGAVPDADAFHLLNANAILVLALLVCGLVAALALRVVLRCALRVTRRACYGDGAQDVHPERTGGGAEQPTARLGRGRKPPQRRLAALVQALPCLAYSAGLELAGSSRSECAICLAEFARGDRVRVLPRCNHGFHARCIDRWLAARPTCPTCRQAAFAEPPITQPNGAGPVAVVRVVIVGDGVTLRMEP
ncbi:RING-H2 finger protein ATL72-like [Phragmites australis]|uniref:RING-H2 finger protein ATL72-like n=1 Tax=Phragmites australis TaxID=29695 RepID=UPI002D77396B|nr:RING-H2 finger protein ATL72-like [Phragmites australis]